MKQDLYMREKRKRPAPAPAREKRGATPTPIVVTDQNLDELCERLKKLPEDSPEYDRLADALNRYMWS